VLSKITCEINPHPNTSQSTIALHTTLAFTYLLTSLHMTITQQTCATQHKKVINKQMLLLQPNVECTSTSK
jgi:hypothetical protein